MAKLNVSICSHTGMASLIIVDQDDKTKMDLMPDEVKEAKIIAEQNPDNLKSFLFNIDSAFAAKLEPFSLLELQEGILHPKCDI